ncbi:hypothetical protein SAMN02982990_02803 [Photorhabdus luminescens]|uniref:Uncharacterized protein n=1 Tax=Photorhabdus luminescens TaxID=29488 RepID=A0A1G5R0V1_PHOLU|nr:hypothetical protein SAMN02982990_02803 [Photorhabdus luminescens]
MMSANSIKQAVWNAYDIFRDIGILPICNDLFFKNTYSMYTEKK